MVGSFITTIAEDGSVTCGSGGDVNTRYGEAALMSNIAGSGSANTAFGWQALKNYTVGEWNTAIETDALGDNTEGRFDTAVGANAKWHNITGNKNTATGVGFAALSPNDPSWARSSHSRDRVRLHTKRRNEGRIYASL